LLRDEPMETIIACENCGLVQRMEELQSGTAAECGRCGSIIAERKVNSIGRTAAFSLAALILYVPANISPILRMNYYGAYSENTVWTGCVKLLRTASGWWQDRFSRQHSDPTFRARAFLFGRHGEIQIYAGGRTDLDLQDYRSDRSVGDAGCLLLSVLVALVMLGVIATVVPGPGLLAFTAVVVLTILASASFDTKLIWDEPDRVS
jgi:paraquat-inducible protein A